ncbi:hypothetical protein D3C87_1907700 [compost metagenome]
MSRHPECTCSWSPCHHSNYGVQDALEADNKRLKAENESLRKDAERYRWLRGSKHFDSPQHRAFCEFYTDGLDSAIDAAISSPENP